MPNDRFQPRRLNSGTNALPSLCGQSSSAPSMNACFNSLYLLAFRSQTHRLLLYSQVFRPEDRICSERISKGQVPSPRLTVQSTT